MVKPKPAAHCLYLRGPEARMSTQELNTLAGANVTVRMFESHASSPCRHAHGRTLQSCLSMWISSHASHASRTPLACLANRQARCRVLSTPLRSPEPRPHPHANKPALLQAQRTSEPCKMGRRWGPFGVPKAMRSPPRANPVGHPQRPPSQIRADVAASMMTRERIWSRRRSLYI